MRAGRLTTRVQLQKRVETQNEIGEPVTTWIPIRTVYAGVEPLRGKELIEAGMINQSIQTRVVVRYHPDLTSADRVALGNGRYLSIVGAPIDVENQHFTLELMCEEGLYKGAPS